VLRKNNKNTYAITAFLYSYVTKISDRQPKISDSLKISDFSDSLGVLQHPLAPQQYAYAGTLSRKFAIKQSINIPPHLKCVTTLPCEILMSEN